MLTTNPHLSLLTTAIATPNSPMPASAIATALLHLEQQTRQERQQIEQASLLGDWRLFFSTSGKIKLGDRRLRGFYWPSWVPAQISFQPASSSDPEAPLQITNQLSLGLIQLKLSGPAKYQAKKNLLAFDFTQIVVSVAGRSLYQGTFPGASKGQAFGSLSIGKLPFFAFFAAPGHFIAARGKGGGLAIWVKV